MKTPMQELIEKITLKTRGDITFLLPSISNSDIEELLEKEKQHIMNAFIEANIQEDIVHKNKEYAEYYYNDLYGE
jgi:hypothetical protein